jgi:hypothetical protein
MHTLIKFLALLLWSVLAFLTAYVLFTSGPSFLVILSILVVAIIGFGVFGALGQPPRRGGPF